MLEWYEIKQKLKSFLEKIGLLNLAVTIYYGVYWNTRHLICRAMAQRRANGYRDGRYEKLSNFSKIHENERCFIVCTGPSLRLEDVEALKDEVTFSMNSIVKIFPKTEWRPNYYLIEDLKAYIMFEQDLLQYNIKERFASDFLIHTLKPKVSFISYPFDRLNHSLVRYRSSKTPRFAFSGDAYSIVYGGFTVTYSAIQLAVYMGFKEIYLLGCDCNYSGEKKHFIEYPTTVVDTPNRQEELMIQTYKVAKEYADSHGIKIYNATRGGKLEVFDRVDFDRVLETH